MASKVSRTVGCWGPTWLVCSSSRPKAATCCKWPPKRWVRSHRAAGHDLHGLDANSGLQLLQEGQELHGAVLKQQLSSLPVLVCERRPGMEAFLTREAMAPLTQSLESYSNTASMMIRIF